MNDTGCVLRIVQPSTGGVSRYLLQKDAGDRTKSVPVGTGGAGCCEATGSMIALLLRDDAGTTDTLPPHAREALKPPASMKGAGAIIGRWRPRSGPALAALGGILLMLLIGLAAGQDYNYDLENYHFSSSYLLLSGGMDWNVAPSGIQSWFNPIGYAPAMLAIRSLPPILVSALLAIVAGLNAPLLYKLADSIGAGLPDRERSRAAFGCTLLGMTGAIVISEAATTYLDIVLSIAQLGALLAAIRATETRERRAQARYLGWAGLLFGLASGLKLTVAVLALGLTIALLVIARRCRFGLAALAAYAGSGLLGFLMAGGWWGWHLWHAYGNPIFPIANNLFHSPLAPAEPLNDKIFLPKSWTDAFTHPWHWLIGDRTPGAEIPIRDPRYMIGLVASLAVLPLSALRGAGVAAKGEGALLLSLFLLLSYIIWLPLFGILRYLLVVEMLGGVMLLALLLSLPRLSPKAVVTILFVGLFCTIGWTRSANWGREPFTGDWFGVTGIAEVHRPGTLYIMPDGAPLAFMIGLFPDDARFAHIGGNLPLDPAHGLGPRVMQMIRQAPVVRTLAASPDNSSGIAALRRFGLTEVPGTCRLLTAKVAVAESCLLMVDRPDRQPLR